MRYNSESMSNQAFSIKPEPAMLQKQPSSDPVKDLWALVPAKKLAEAKRRLASCLGAEREAFTIAMFRDVIAALHSSEEVSKIMVVTGDPQLAAIAKQQDILVLEENGSIGLNQAIDLGINEIRKLGGRRIAILPADIPLLTGAEFDRVVRDYKHQTLNRDQNLIGISACTGRNGTNCLFINTQQSFKLRYGPGSYKLHSDSAEKQEYGPIQLHSITISMDIDEQQDLNALLSFCELHPEFQKSETWSLLHNIKYNLM